MTRMGATFAGRSGPLRMATIVVVILAVGACAMAGWFGLSWYWMAHDESFSRAMARENVLQDAQQAAINVNTLDYRRALGGFELWERTATGAALEEFRKNRDEYVQRVIDSRMISAAKVQDGAVAELDDQAGTARVLVGVDVTYAPENQEASCDRQRLQLEMKRTPYGWKVDQLARFGSLEPVPGACPGAEPEDSPPN